MTVEVGGADLCRVSFQSAKTGVRDAIKAGMWNCTASREGTSGPHELSQSRKTWVGLEMPSVLGWHGVLLENFMHAHRFMSNKKS